MLVGLCIVLGLVQEGSGQPYAAAPTEQDRRVTTQTDRRATGKESSLPEYLGKPTFRMSRVFSDQRFPNIVVTPAGTLVALFGSNGLRARRSEDAGITWGAPIVVTSTGISGGGAIATSAGIHVFVEAKHPPAPFRVFISEDDARTWRSPETPPVIVADRHGNVPSLHMNEAGIVLQRGKHKGRLVRAARWYADGNRKDQWPHHYTTAIYSDDRGRNWKTSKPFAEKGTGEAAVVELSDGRLYYNSRIHWPEAPRPTRRRHAWSDDGGVTFRDWGIVDALPDGQQTRAYGCMGGLVRLPIRGRDILLFSNLDTRNARREKITVWVSFDGGKTWPLKRLVYDGPAAYSSFAAGRAGTPTAGLAFLHFEGGGPDGRGSHVAGLNLSWLLRGERTGNGKVPRWVRHR